MGNQSIKEIGQEYVMNTYNRLPLALVKGDGARVWDADGKEYLDLVSGIAVNSLGHNHPALVEAVSQQVSQLIHVSNIYWIESQVNLARLLVENSCFQRVFFANSGAEANEGAIKLARKYAKKHLGEDRFEIITARQSFHGRTLATLTATGQEKYQQGFDPLPPGFQYVPFNDLEAIKKAIGPNTCAIMLEPIQGEGGVHPAEDEYLQGIRDICNEEGILLIFDEIQTGVGRTGKLFAYQAYGIEPDIMTLAKGLGGGVPIGALLAKEEIANAFQPGDHATTFGGNPLATRAGLTVVETILKENILANVEEIGAYFVGKLEELKEKYPIIKDVRGKGLMLGMELTVPVADGVNFCLEKGLLVNFVGGNIFRFLPPLIISKEEIDEAIKILDQAIEQLA